MEHLVTRDPRILQILLPRFLAVVVLFSIVVASLLSATHQVNFVLHGNGLTYEVTTQNSGETDADDNSLSTVVAICAAGFLCNATLALIGQMDSTDPTYLTGNIGRPSQGFSLEGLIVDVVTPPPLVKSA